MSDAGLSIFPKLAGDSLPAPGLLSGVAVVGSSIAIIAHIPVRLGDSMTYKKTALIPFEALFPNHRRRRIKAHRNNPITVPHSTGTHEDQSFGGSGRGEYGVWR